MPIPLIPIISALAAGGSLVPHATGGLIVTGASGYIAGTFLSTTAINGLLATASATLGAGALFLSGTTASIVGGAGIFGTTIGATGITGALMSAGIISSTPVWVPFAASCAALGCGYGGYRLLKLKRKLNETPEGEEAQFTETEAKIIEKIIKRLAKKKKPDNEADIERTSMEKEEILLAQKLIDKINVGDKKCLKEIYDREWENISESKNFGKLFKNAVSEKMLTNIKYIGVRSIGHCDEYLRVNTKLLQSAGQ